MNRSLWRIDTKLRVFRGAVVMVERHKIKCNRILIVARWPLGGIRTYMRYTFRHLPQEYQLTLLASSTHEDEALRRDVLEYGAQLIITRKHGLAGLVIDVFRELHKNNYDLIISQGFISAVAAYIANLFFSCPHVLTVHGVVESKFLDGNFKWLKQVFLAHVLSKVTVIYAVSQDILTHLFDQFPSLRYNSKRSIVIPNGIEMSEFELSISLSKSVRSNLGISAETFLFGFFSRFMPQKGFDLLIEAVEILSKKENIHLFKVLAVGTDDYRGRYLKVIKERNLEEYFYFLPFQPQIKNLYIETNAIVMPSRWEAWPLLPMEALSMGVPIITSDCIGLREVVAGTPAIMFRSEDINGLVQSMLSLLSDSHIENFKKYIPIARQRFDVVSSARQLSQLIKETI